MPSEPNLIVPARDLCAVSDGAPAACVACTTWPVGSAPGSATHTEVALSNTKPKGDESVAPERMVAVCAAAVGEPVPILYKPAAPLSWNVAYTWPAYTDARPVVPQWPSVVVSCVVEAPPCGM